MLFCLLMLVQVSYFSLLHFSHLSRLLFRSVELGVEVVFGSLANALQLENHVGELLSVQVVPPYPLKLPDLSPSFQKFLLNGFILSCRRRLQSLNFLEEPFKPAIELIVLLLAPCCLSERELVVTMTLQCIEVSLTILVIFKLVVSGSHFKDSFSDVDNWISFSNHTSFFFFALVHDICTAFICHVTPIAATELIILPF